MRYETRTVRPSSNNQKESLVEHDRVTNSQERDQDIRSRTTPRSPMTRELSQTSENATKSIHMSEGDGSVLKLSANDCAILLVKAGLHIRMVIRMISDMKKTVKQ